MNIIKALRTAVLSLLLLFAFTGSAYAAGGKVDAEPHSSTLNQGQSETITVTLDAPIICSISGPTCNVVVNYASSDPASISLSNPTLTWTESAWFQPMQFNITALAPSNCATSETDTISATAVSNSVYFSNFQSSFSVTINSQPPYAAPGITDQTVDLVNNGSSIDTNVINGVSGCPDSSTLAIVSGPSHGTAVDPPGSITYTPNSGYAGSDSLVYKVCSLLDATVCSTATLNYNITAAAPDTGFGTHVSHPMAAVLSYGLGVTSLFSLAFGLRKLSKRTYE